jgi:hypothetical protein
VHLVQETLRTRDGDQALRLLDLVEANARRASFEIRLTGRQLRRIRAFWSVSAALDDLERGMRWAASSRLLLALRLDPSSLTNARGCSAAFGILLGRRVGRFVGGELRNRVREHRRAKARAMGT